MKKIYTVVLIAVISGLAMGKTGITITEMRLENGDSMIKVVNAIRGVTKNYTINLSKHHYPATSPDDPLVRKYKSWEFGAFLCYNSNQYSGSEFCTSKDPVTDFNPTALDVKQWTTMLNDAGMNYAVLTVRHTSEFLLWDSLTSEINIMNSSYKKDLVREYVDECRRRGIVAGIYYCLWGGEGWRPDSNARAVILAQLHELATQYGAIDYFWLDMPHRTKWLTPDLSEQEIYDSLKNINPESVVMFNHGVQDGSNSVYPTDVVNGEMHQPPAEGYNPWRTSDSKKYYIPFEYEPCSQQREGRYHSHPKWGFPGASWFTYGSGRGFLPSKSFSAEFLYRRIRAARDRGASNVLLSCGPDYTGRFRPEDVKQLVKLGKMLKDPSLAPPRPMAYYGKASSSGEWDNDYTADKAFDDNPSTRWGGPKNSKDGWLAIDLGKPRQFAKVTISEGWDRIQKFELQVKRNGTWETIHKGTTIGMNYSATFKPVTAQEVRLNITEATDVPTIWEFQLFKNLD